MSKGTSTARNNDLARSLSVSRIDMQPNFGATLANQRSNVASRHVAYEAPIHRDNAIATPQADLVPHSCRAYVPGDDRAVDV